MFRWVYYFGIVFSSASLRCIWSIKETPYIYIYYPQNNTKAYSVVYLGFEIICTESNDIYYDIEFFTKERSNNEILLHPKDIIFQRTNSSQRYYEIVIQKSILNSGWNTFTILIDFYKTNKNVPFKPIDNQNDNNSDSLFSNNHHKILVSQDLNVYIEKYDSDILTDVNHLKYLKSIFQQASQSSFSSSSSSFTSSSNEQTQFQFRSYIITIFSD